MIHIIDLKFQGYAKAVASYLVEAGKELVLVETGPHSTLPELLDQVESLGFDPNNISRVFLSHIHLDHAGAAWYFAEHGAKVHVHPLGAPHLAMPDRLMASATRIYGSDMDRLWGKMKAIDPSLLVEAEDRQAIEVDGTFFIPYFTPGHAVHHVAWRLEDQLFCGDVAGIKIQQGPSMVPCPPPDIDIEAWKQSIALIKTLPLKQLLLTHFGPTEEITSHLEEVEICLHQWSQWVKQQMQQGLEASQMIDPFKKIVAEQLSASGLNSREIESYEAANPSWMSVYGLVRYWTKKSST